MKKIPVKLLLVISCTSTLDDLSLPEGWVIVGGLGGHAGAEMFSCLGSSDHRPTTSVHDTLYYLYAVDEQ